MSVRLERQIHASADFAEASYVPFKPFIVIASGTHLISRSGMILTNANLAWKSNYQFPLDLFLQTWIISAASFVRRGAGRVEPQKGKRLGIVHTSWTLTYYHWLTESLPRILALTEAFPEAVPIFPHKEYENHAESLRAIGVDEFLTFPPEKNLIARDVLISASVPKYGTIDPAELIKVRDRIISYYQLTCDKPSEVVYVTRRNASCRRVVNESEVLEALAPYHPTIAVMEELTFKQQVELMCSANVLIGPHGAGLANMMFMPKGSFIMEFVPDRRKMADYNRARQSRKADPCFVRLADAMGHTHGFVACESKAGQWSSTHSADMVVNIPAMKKAVDSLVSAAC